MSCNTCHQNAIRNRQSLQKLVCSNYMLRRLACALTVFMALFLFAMLCTHLPQRQVR